VSEVIKAQKQVDFRVEQTAHGKVSVSVSPFRFCALYVSDAHRLFEAKRRLTCGWPMQRGSSNADRRGDARAPRAKLIKRPQVSGLAM